MNPTTKATLITLTLLASGIGAEAASAAAATRLDVAIALPGADPAALAAGETVSRECRIVRRNGEVEVYVDGARTEVLAESSIETLTINGGDADDTLVVDTSGGLIDRVIYYNGGEGFDTLVAEGAPVDEVEYTVGPGEKDGILEHRSGEARQTVIFTGLEPVNDNVVAANLFINATNADNAINYSQGPGGGIFIGDTFLVSVDNFETYEGNNKTNVILNGNAGSDDINVNNPVTPAGLTGTITVNAGDPPAAAAGLGDALNVQSNGSIATLSHTPATPGSGIVALSALPDVLFNQAEFLLIDGVPQNLNLPDAQEPNDSIAQATVLGSPPALTLDGLTLHLNGGGNLNEDFFKITANQTGMLIVNALFTDDNTPADGDEGDIDIEVQDSGANLIASSTSATDNEQIVIPVVAQQNYYVRVFSPVPAGDPNTYALEIENFAAPKPSQADLVPASDTGMMDDDNLTADNTPTFLLQADLQSFFNMGIFIDPGMGLPGADVVISATSLSTGAVTMIDAPRVDPGTPNNNLWTGTFLPLADGQYFIEAWVRIADGQLVPVVGRGILSAPLTVTIDATAPAAPIAPDLLNSSDSGLSQTDNITNKMEPAFSGTGPANAKVRVYADGLLVGQSVITTAGNWEITVEPLIDGVYAITAEQEDLAGNVSAMSPPMAPSLTIDTIDPQRPTLDLPDILDSGTSSFDNVTNTPAPALAFVISAELGSTFVVKDGELVVAGPLPFDAAFDASDGVPANGFGLLFIPIATEGNHPLSVEATDVAGNISAQAEELGLQIDRTAPTIPAPIDLNAASDTGMDATDNVTAINQPALSGVVFGTLGDAPLKVFLFDGAALIGETDILVDFPFPSDSRAFEITTEPLADGVRMIQAGAEDLAGNFSPLSPPLQIWIDTAVPNTPHLDLLNDTGTSPSDNITQANLLDLQMTGNDTVDGTDNPFPNDVKYRVYWRPDATGEVLIYDSFTEFGDFTTLGSLTRTASQTLNNPAGVPFPDGPQQFKLEVEDRAGNVSPDFLLDFTVDSAVPPASMPDLLPSSDSGMLNDDNVTNKMQPAFNGTSEAGAQVRVSANGLVVGQSTVGSDATDGIVGNGLGNWEVTVEPLTDGTYDITTQIEDLAGNLTPPSGPLQIWIDTAVPNTPALDVMDTSDSGPFNNDDVTNDSSPTVVMTGSDTVFPGPNPFPNDLKYRLYDRPEALPDEQLIYDSFVALGDFTTVGEITLTTAVLPEGLHDLKLEVEDRAGNISPDFLLPLVIDTVDPMDPGGVTITSHTLGVPSQEMVIDAMWTPGTDANSGLFGYAYTFNNTAVATCDELKDLDPTTTDVSSSPLADGSWWFHICTGDLAGNWTSTVVVGDAIIDTVSPTVAVVNSVADTGDGMLADFEATPTPITQVVLTFDEAMADPAGDTGADDVTNPLNYLLVRAGFNELIETAACQTGAAGDDIEIVINKVVYDAPSTTAHLVVNNGFSLDEDSYRVLFCGTNSMSSASSTFGLEDIAENDFDGDGDGVGGDDQSVDFEITESNLLRNPNFDEDLASWIPLAPADTTFAAGADAGMVVNSGSAALSSGAGGANEALSQCVFPLGEDRKFSFGSKAKIEVASATAPIQSIMVDFFQTGDCSGTVLASSSTSSVVGSTAGAFSPDMGETTAPGSAGSALVTFLVDGTSGPAPPYTVNLDSVFFHGMPTPVAMATGDVDGDGIDDLAADFGAMGIWVYYSNGGTPSWSPITSVPGEGNIVIGDLDGTGKAEVVVDFGAMGMWAWSNNANWFQMTPFNAGAMTTADVDGNGSDEVIADFDDLSVWISFNYVSWRPLTSADAVSLGSGDVDGNGREDVIGDFGPLGLWVYLNNQEWIAISPEKVGTGGVATADTNGDDNDEVVADFRDLGVWSYDWVLGWSPVSVANPEGFAAGDTTGNGLDELFFDLGANRGIWKQIDGLVPGGPLVFLNPDAISIGDFNANNLADLVVDFGAGPGLGLWVLFDNTTWVQLTALSP